MSLIGGKGLEFYGFTHREYRALAVCAKQAASKQAARQPRPPSRCSTRWYIHRYLNLVPKRAIRKMPQSA